MVPVPFAPCVMVKLLGEVESVKFGVGRGFTVSEIVAVFVKLPEVPLMLTVAAPVEAVLLAVSVKVLVAAAGFGLNDAITPLGRPEAVRLTLPLKPLRGVMVMVLEPLAPCVKVRLLGEVETRYCRGPWPVVHQVGGIEGANAGGEVPAYACAVSGAKRTIGGGEHTDGAAPQVAIGANAVHVHVALSYIIENTGTRNRVSVARVARSVAARTVLGSRELIVNGVGITLARSSLLIHKGLDAGHDGGGKGSSTRAGPAARGS